MAPQLADFSLYSIITLVVGVFIPLLTGLLSKVSWPGVVKSVISLGLSAAIGVLQGFLQAPPGQDFNWYLAIANGLVAWLIAIGMYAQIWSKTGLTDALQTVGVKDKVSYDIDALPARGEKGAPAYPVEDEDADG